MKNTSKQKWDALVRIHASGDIEIVEQNNRLGFTPVTSRPSDGILVIELKQIVIPDGYRMYVDQVCIPHWSGGELVCTTKVSGNSEDKEVIVTCQEPDGTFTNRFADVYIKVRFRRTFPTA